MKIIQLVAENIKRLVAVEITPDGNMVEIKGKNGEGKTSVLDSIWWALSGASHIQAVPIRKGANKARIRLDLGELIVTRVFKKAKGGSTTTSIAVENASGQKMTSPQTILNGIIGELSFDPLAFSRMTAKEQLESLRRFVPGVNFDKIEEEHAADFSKRTEINRQVKRAQALADAINVPEGTPGRLIDESALVEELQKAGEHNAEIEQRKARREEAARTIEQEEGVATRHREDAGEVVKQIHVLQEKEKHLLQLAKDADANAANMKSKLLQADRLPDPIDPSEIRGKINKARDVNAYVTLSTEKASHLEEVSDLEEKAEALTHSMENRQTDKRLAIEKAKMPVKEISLGDGGVLLNGVPFEQASDAERLRVSVSIAMARNPKLRVIRVRDGSLLDDDSMKLLAEMADTADYQIWIERVDSNAKTGIVLEGGRVKDGVVEKELLTPDLGGQEA